LAQTARITQLRDPKGAGLEKLFSFSENDLTAMAVKHEESHQVAVIAMPADGILFYPEIGFFQFPIPIQNRLFSNLLGLGIAVPLLPGLAFVTFSKTADAGWLFRHRIVLERYSLGLSENCRRVVLPPHLDLQNKNALSQHILETRRLTIEEEAAR